MPPTPPPRAARRLTLGVLGTTGGCGTTLLATQGAALLAPSAAARGHRLALLDLDPAGGQALAWLHDRRDRATVADALRAGSRLDGELLQRLMTPCAPGLHLLAGAPLGEHAGRLGPPGDHHDDPAADGIPVGLAALTTLIDTTHEAYERVVLDLGRAGCWPPHTLAALVARCDHLALCTRAELPSAGQAREWWRWLASASSIGTQRELVVSAAAPHDALTPREVAQAVQAGDGAAATLAARVTALPHSPRLLAQALQQGLPLGALDDRDPLARALERWAQARLAQLEQLEAADGRAARNTEDDHEGEAAVHPADASANPGAFGDLNRLWQRTTRRLGAALRRTP